MKKFLLLLILIFCSFAPSACSCGKEEPTITATKLDYKVAMNQTLLLDNIITVTGTDNGYETIVSNKSVLSITDGIVTPLTPGETEVKCRIIGHDDKYVILSILVRDVYLAKSATIPKSEVTINMGAGKSAINKPQFSETVTEIPNIIYDTNIVGYDYATGTITARAIGETTIKIFYELCQVEFKVTVLKIVYTDYMSAEDIDLYVGDKGVFDFTIYPTDANQYRFYTFDNCLTIDSNGGFLAKNSSTATVYYEYYTSSQSEPIVGEFSVRIFELPDNLNFKVVDDNYDEIYYVFKGETHKILFEFTEYELLENFAYSDNIEVISEHIETDGFGNKYILFKAIESGLLNITISCNREIENVDRILSKTREIMCYDYSQIEIVAKYSIYPLSPNQNGEYMLNISGIDAGPNEVTFLFSVEETNITGWVNIYLVNSGKQEVGNTFRPTATGRYQFVAEYKGVQFCEIVVVVE
ncbi:MAG: hypothetical protein E7354_00025 [Clostridiales bacterium]|nr:hypothetical protein [Clostridiales bacterium]